MGRQVNPNLLFSRRAFEYDGLDYRAYYRKAEDKLGRPSRIAQIESPNQVIPHRIAEYTRRWKNGWQNRVIPFRSFARYRVLQGFDLFGSSIPKSIHFRSIG